MSCLEDLTVADRLGWLGENVPGIMNRISLLSQAITQPPVSLVVCMGICLISCSFNNLPWIRVCFVACLTQDVMRFGRC